MTTLAELRQASLKEQKQKEQQYAPDTTTPPVVAPAEAVPPAVQAPVPVYVPTSNGNGNGNGHHAPPLAAAPAPVVSPPPAPSPEAAKAEKFFADLHETLSHKTVYPSGAKVSADMPPALFHRAKRYCLDHGNITLRQVLIALLTTYLEEEGY